MNDCLVTLVGELYCTYRSGGGGCFIFVWARFPLSSYFSKFEAAASCIVPSAYEFKLSWCNDCVVIKMRSLTFD